LELSTHEQSLIVKQGLWNEHGNAYVSRVMEKQQA
jgi:hypothetical protein